MHKFFEATIGSRTHETNINLIIKNNFSHSLKLILRDFYRLILLHAIHFNHTISILNQKQTQGEISF